MKVFGSEILLIHEGERLERLRDAAGQESAKDVVLEALRLYEFLVEKHAEGNTFKMCWQSAGDELSLPINLFEVNP
jgi:hypothetical protein